MRKNILALATIGMLLLSSLMIMPTVGASGNTIYVDDDNTSGPWNGTQEYPYQNIQDGINNSDNGDTVFVYNGTYYENVIINKSVNLVGEDKKITVVDAVGGIYALRIINISEIGVSGFTIKNADYGIEIINSSGNTIEDNIIKENGVGLEIGLSSNNIITSNNITDNSAIGIELITLSTYNIIAKNNILNNGEDPFIGYGLAMSDSSDNNTIYHNNFIDNKHSVTDDCNNTYDNDYEGNYWSDFDEPSEGAYDNNSDRIVDTPYNISDGDNQGRYPLMFPFGEIPPVANFTYEVDGHSVQFHSSAYDRDGTIESYFWEFDDGFNSTEENPPHEYGGEYTTYTVNLTVTDNDGYVDKISMSVTTGDTTPPVIHNIIPEKGIYINGVKRLPRLIRMPLIIGDITIEVNATDGESGIKQVNFTIDPLRPFAKQVANDTTAPYTYNWTKKVAFRFVHVHLIKIDVIDNAGNIATKRMVVRRIL